jgi:hypothetical protein
MPLYLQAAFNTTLTSGAIPNSQTQQSSDVLQATRAALKENQVLPLYGVAGPLSHNTCAARLWRSLLHSALHAHRIKS